MTKNKVVMVVERSNISLDIKKGEDGKSYILEGIFTTFGVLNNNKRVYEEAEYLPHLEYLTKKIQKGRLIGELDHPEKFDISLDKASHIIEHLEYNKDSRTITGRVRLLSTPSGNTARALLDDGVQLSISSRAAGVVKEDNSVQIKKIFTYDLVADPGFDNAQLNRINESVGISKDNEDISVYEMNMTEDELDNLINSSDMKSNNSNENKQYIKENKESDTMNKEAYVTIEEFVKYSSHIREEFSNFENQLAEKDEEIAFLNRKLQVTESYLEHVADETNNMVSNITLEGVNSELTDEILNRNAKLEGYVKYLSETIDRIISYQAHQTNEHNHLETYIDSYLSEELKNGEIVVENIGRYQKYLAELLDRGLQYSEHVAEEIKHIIDYTDDFSVDFNILESYTTNIIKEKLNIAINFANYLSEELNRSNGDLLEGSYLGINESRDDVNILIDNSKTIGNKIDQLIESVQIQKTNDTTSKADSAYFNLLSESKKREFLILPDNQKQKVSASIKKYKPLSEKEFVEIWESALTTPKHEDYVNVLLENMPNEYRPIWESLDQNIQDRMIAQAKYSNINISNPYAISNFWQTRTPMNQKLEFQPLNEAETITENEKNKTLGYQDNYMNSIASSLDKLNKR